MMFIIQCLILCIGIGVFVLQHHIKKYISVVASKLVYWTTLLFMGIVFNWILYEIYPDNYVVSNYYTRENLIILATIIVGGIIFQLAAPSEMKLFSLNKADKYRLRQQQLQEIYGDSNTYQEKSNYFKELHFEIFLETICWLGFIFALVIEAMMDMIKYMPESGMMFEGLKDTVCLMMILCIPIALRQILFYLYRIRRMKDEENLPEVEVHFQKKLRKKNMYL